MTEDELSALSYWLRSFPFSGNMTCGQVSEAGEMCMRALEAIASLSASLANCERRAEEAEARALFFETEMTRVLQEGAKKS